jgi:hypothetical protein
MLAYTRISYVIEHKKSSHVYMHIYIYIYNILKIDIMLLAPTWHLLGTISVVSIQLASNIINLVQLAAD